MQGFKKKYVFLSIGFLAVVTTIVLFFYLARPEPEKLYIALASPQTGPNKNSGQNSLQGVELYLQEINAMGGINGKQIELLVYDDLDQIEETGIIAEKIVNSEALVVLGHDSSGPAFKGAEIYRQGKIPAITASASYDGITKDNEWYFSVINTNNDQAKFLSYYFKYIMQQSYASIIYDNQNVYSSSLAKQFAETFKEIGGKIDYVWSFDSNKKGLHETFDEITHQLAQAYSGEGGIIFLPLVNNISEELIVLIRRRGLENMLVGADAWSEELLRSFSHHPEEKEKPGYFSDDLYATTSLIFDVAGKSAQLFRNRFIRAYGHEPLWNAATYYDAAMVAVEALRTVETQNPYATRNEKRRQIRDYLASLTSGERMLKGITAEIRFDEQGKIVKPVMLGFFKDRQFISAMEQLREVPCDQYSQSLLKMDDICLQRIHIVYTGIRINEIKDINLDDLTYHLDFDLWFRYQGRNLDVQNIEFLNALEPINLTEPIAEKQRGQALYKHYHVQGLFKINFLADMQAFGKSVLSVAFRHRELDRSKLIYVKDTLRLSSDKAYHDVQHINIPNQWKVKETEFFQDIFKKDSLGDPEYLSASGKPSYFSRFNVDILIAKDQLSLRGIMSEMIALYITLLSGISLIVTSWLLNHKTLTTQKLSLRYTWLGHAVLSILLILSMEVYVIEFFKETMTPFRLTVLLRSFDVWWWLLMAHLANTALDEFLWSPIETRTQQIVPQVVRHTVSTLLYLFAVMGIIAFVFDQAVTSLLATGGVLAMIIGLAVRINITNIFSGIAINIERPFRIGDWVKIGNHAEGTVLDINWRATRISVAGNIVSIPNGIAAESVISNYNLPDDSYWLSISIPVDVEQSPNHVQEVLRSAVLSVEEILHEPEPAIFTTYNEWSMVFTIAFCAKNYANRSKYKTRVVHAIWKHLQQADISYAKAKVI